jgi:hypothetical protein
LRQQKGFAMPLTAARLVEQDNIAGNELSEISYVVTITYGAGGKRYSISNAEALSLSARRVAMDLLDIAQDLSFRSGGGG